MKKILLTSIFLLVLLTPISRVYAAQNTISENVFFSSMAQISSTILDFADSVTEGIRAVFSNEEYLVVLPQVPTSPSPLPAQPTAPRAPSEVTTIYMPSAVSTTPAPSEGDDAHMYRYIDEKTTALYDRLMRSMDNLIQPSGGSGESVTGDVAEDDLSDNSLEDFPDINPMTKMLGDLLSWNGTAWTNVATSSLGISGGGGGTTSWGGILGTLANQTDLQSALNAKFSLSAWQATTTDALGEGTTNKYYTTSRVQTYLDFVSKSYFFSTTSASYFLAQNQGNAYSTTSASYFESQQTARNADNLTDNSVEDLSDVASMTKSYGDLFLWNGTSWTNAATSSLGISGGGSGTWGSITGTLSSQTDLQAALDVKLSLSNWFATTTDALAEGTTNKYFSNTLARGAISNSITGITYTSGTGVFSLTSGYTIPLTASTTEWGTAYANRITSASYPLQISSNILSLAFGTTTVNTWSQLQTFASGFVSQASSTVSGLLSVENIINNGLSANTLIYANGSKQLATGSVSAPLSFSTGTLSITQSNGSTNGYLSSTDWTAFNNKISSTSIDTSAELAALITNETGTGALVFGTSPTFTTQITVPTITTASTLALQATGANIITASTNGSERLRIDSAGDVGVGTTDPLSKLQVAGGAIIGGTPVTGTGVASIAAGILNVFSPTAALSSTVTTEAALRIARNGTYNARFNQTADFNIGSYATGLNAMTQLDIRLGNGNTNAPDMTVMSLLANGNVGIGTTSPATRLSVQGNGLFSGTATVGNLINTGLTANSFIYANGSKQLATGSVSAPLSFTAGTLAIAQATTGANGYLSSTDWNTFNNKQATLSFTYPFVNTANTISLAFGTTTTNTWSALQTFSNATATQLTVTGNTYLATTGGLVGIGTTTPTALYGGKLAVAGPIFVGGASTTATSTFEGNARVIGNLAVGSGTTWIRDNATSTFSGGINLTNGGCFAVNGVCVGGGGADTVVRLSAVRSYTSGATWTKPSDLSYVLVEVWGGGGGGYYYSNGAGGAGGGGGGYAQERLPGSTLNSTETVTVGAGGSLGYDTNGTSGGTSSFGTTPYLSASGGGASSGFTAGGGGSGSGGDLNLTASNGFGLNQYGYSSGGDSPRGGGNGGGTGENGRSGGVVVYEYTTVTSGTDLAELYPVSSPAVSAGDIVAFDEGEDAFAVKRAVKDEGRPLAGIIATNPGIVLSEKAENEDAIGQRPVALSGRVPTKVSLENGPIRAGDRITLSSVPGVGMKAGSLDDSVGIALEAYISETSSGTITVFLNLQQGIDVQEIGERLLAQPDATSTSAFDFVGRIVEIVRSKIFGAPGTGAPLFVVNGFENGATTTPFAISSNGSVGVGTNAPWATLAVAAATDPSALSFAVGSSTTPSFVVNGAGNVGIGTSTPLARLTVDGDGIFTGTLTASGFMTNSSLSGAFLNATDATASSTVAGTLVVGADVSGIRFLTPATVPDFIIGSTTITTAIPSEVLTLDGANVDLYKLSTYALAKTQLLATQVGALDITIDEIKDRLALLEEATEKLNQTTQLSIFGIQTTQTSTAEYTLEDLGLALDMIASTTSATTSSSTPGSVRFATSFWKNVFAKVSEWIGDSANGIKTVVAGQLRAKESICVDDQCLSKDDVRVLLEMARERGSAGVGASVNTPTPTPEPEPPAPVDSQASSTPTAPAPEAPTTPAPAPTPEPEPQPAPEPVVVTPATPEPSSPTESSVPVEAATPPATTPPTI